ncbi:MAG: prepilin-type N-terminal cleavage/methylation domain-containing protein [Bacilli bacterium]|nr:prepilin-type N-terminal cleavage/methylation domain-containing protein [Bacilli bacterium]
MKNKKGFTLVEILAVLVVLLVIVLIAINVVNSRVKQAKKNSVEVNANNYIKAVNGVAALSQNIGEDMEKGTYQVRDLNKTEIKISGEKPRKGSLTLSDYEVSYGCLMYDEYSAIIIDGKTASVEKMNCNDFFVNKEFDYKGSEEVFTVNISGTYKIEAWGAQGGNANDSYIGGYGAYSVGYVDLKKGDRLYINVGGQGESECITSNCNGGYNGGGGSIVYTGDQNNITSGGGGATHVALVSGLLSSLSSNVNKILIVAGGGGGAYYHTNGTSYSANGGNGGGYIGTSQCNSNTSYTCAGSGNQSTGGSAGSSGVSGAFGIGGTSTTYSSGGGSGYYGGGSAHHRGTGGGSGYIGNSKLYNAAMYCYNCSTSNVANIKTLSVTCSEDDPQSKCAKKGNGYVKITYSPDIEPDSNVTEFSFTNGEQKFTVSKTGTYKLEVWGAQGGSANGYTGGYGAYSVGEINLTKGTKLYINVGGQGTGVKATGNIAGGYNGGGSGRSTACNNDSNRWGTSGGGATSIAKVSGQLKDLDETKNKNDILIVAGGGGGAFNSVNWYFGDGGSGGGINGVSGYSYRTDTGFMVYPTGGSQTAGGTGGTNYAQEVLLPILNGGFGYAGNSPEWETCVNGGAGGGGFYGGGAGVDASGAGGSGYIANLTNAAMYCYNCTENTNPSTYTYKINQAVSDPTPQKAKTGNGYAIITKIN